MGKKLQDMLELVTPAMIFPFVNRLRGHLPKEIYGLSGNYHNWDEAKSASTGYDNGIILEKTKTALFKVKKGDAAYERDSVLFDEIQYDWPVLAGLMWVAAQCGGRLNVLDFGGSLGSTYFHNRVFLSSLSGEVRWNVVEQPGHVAVGKAYFADATLRFYGSIAECLATGTHPNVVLLSSVLQYLEHSHTVLKQIFELPCGHIIIDRTPFWDGPTDRLCVQRVPPHIYPASYPSWIFSRSQFYSRIHKKWEMMITFDNPDRIAGPVDFSYQGMILVRKKDLP
jgi:putative methyltransferase (TIGR04325 family)